MQGTTMNSGASVPKEEPHVQTAQADKQTRAGLHARLLSHIRPWSEKTIRYLWIAVCALLACVAVFNFYQTQQIQQDMVKRRLMEVSLQDLIIQSTALRHLDNTRSYETKLGLETRGYGSPQELINQLAARLAVIEAINEQTELQERTRALRQQLIRLDNALNSTRQINFTVMDEWFVELSLLNTAMKQSALPAEDKINTLQRNNLILTLIVLFFAVGYVSWSMWLQSKIRQKFASELFYLRNQARTDSLTGLLNRRGWENATDAYLRKMQRQSQLQGSVAIIDIDYFKQYNDTYGHDAGDARLREFAESLKANFRPGDLIARIGGEEFAVLLPNCTAEDAQRIVDRIRMGNQTQVGFSAGICDVALNEGIDRTMAIADQALYQAKNKGRNRSCLAKA